MAKSLIRGTSTPPFLGDRMNNPISPFEKWRLDTIPQVGFTPEIREMLAMAFEGGRQSVLKEKNHDTLDMLQASAK